MNESIRLNIKALSREILNQYMEYNQNPKPEEKQFYNILFKKESDGTTMSIRTQHNTSFEGAIHEGILWINHYARGYVIAELTEAEDPTIQNMKEELKELIDRVYKVSFELESLTSNPEYGKISHMTVKLGDKLNNIKD